MANFAPGAPLHAPPLQTVQSISPGESVKVRLPAFDIQVLPWSSLYLHHHGGLSAPQERHRRPEPGSETLALATVAQEGGCLAAPGGGAYTDADQEFSPGISSRTPPDGSRTVRPLVGPTAACFMGSPGPWIA
jgi:hypothetical protein